MRTHYKEISLKKLCEITGLELPEHLKNDADKTIRHIALIAKHVKEGSAYFVCTENPNVTNVMSQAMENKAAVICISRNAFLNSGLDAAKYPVIFTDNWLDSLGKLFSTIRRSYSATTVAITGTVGKTTTKEFISTILKGERNFFCNNGNRNSFLTVAKHITEELSDGLDTYIQEIGAGTPLSIEKSAAMLQPDYFLFLNVKNHHLNTYKTFEALFNDKASVDKHMPEHGIIIANYDDEAIANHPFIHPVISFGIETEKEVDYKAVNIQEKNGKLRFDIVSKEDSTHISMDILGRHNVYNALAAYILAKQLSVPTQKIAKKLRSYETVGIRQNYRNIGGYHLYVDCYNVAFDSIRAGIDTMDNFTLDKGARRIAVIGGENKLGPEGPSLSYEFGKSLADTNVDYFYCYGRDERTEESLDIYGDGKSICDGILDTGVKHGEFITDQDILIERLRENVKQGDMVFFKGIYLLDMPYVIDSVFGSAFAAKSDHYTKDANFFEKNGYTFKKLPVVRELEINNCTRKRLKIRIPDSINSTPVYRISGKAFANCNLLRKVIIGKNIRNIGNSAFEQCVSIKKITIPENVVVIDNKAFCNCSELKQVTMKNGVQHIGKSAFKECRKLKKIFIPDTVGFIAKNAFKDCPNLTIYCSKDSYAQHYAKKQNITYVLK